ncbi:dTDP-4-dehydrorhamnose reductase [Jatrophihabitans sp.]|uniref:dTDP-4-dehydrorhamnose reductase n=1 Tax=Jatrophihabitans sp. TaxID=1932789 RepID=UPI0030C76FE8|nr:dTDP-4-dehydrorhamnose reductase [Jatrophihabitans sp.]
MVTGAGGQLGRQLLSTLSASGDDVVGLRHADLDITSGARVRAALDTHRPDVVINAAAMTSVDGAESDVARAEAVNAEAPGVIAAAVAQRGGRLLHVSTDYVFAGDAERPYEVDDPTGPRSVYGRSKLAGERLVLASGGQVIRTAWVYGGGGTNFVTVIADLARRRAGAEVVVDQTGSPTYAADLAAGLVELGRSEVTTPVLHFANTGSASRYEFAQAIYRELGADPALVVGVATVQVARPAPRPAWSVLSTRSWQESGLTEPRPWRSALSAALR